MLIYHLLNLLVRNRTSIFFALKTNFINSHFLQNWLGFFCLFFGCLLHGLQMFRENRWSSRLMIKNLLPLYFFLNMVDCKILHIAYLIKDTSWQRWWILKMIWIVNFMECILIRIAMIRWLFGWALWCLWRAMRIFLNLNERRASVGIFHRI